VVDTWTGARRYDRGKGHSYKVDGAPVQGVTTIISQGMPKPALMLWAARSVAQYAVDIAEDLPAMFDRMGRDAVVKALKRVPINERDAAADRGTQVHKYADTLMRGGEVTDVPGELEPYVDSALRFMNDWQPRPLLTETLVASRRWRYAGTFDLVADLPDGRRVLFDYKTSRSGIWPETALQLAAYRNADFYVGTDGVTEVPMAEIGIDEAMAVWVRPDGYSVIPLDTSEPVFRAFLHVQYVARVATAMKAWVLPEVFPAWPDANSSVPSSPAPPVTSSSTVSTAAGPQDSALTRTSTTS
jgi:hypothetical protein